MHNPAKPAHQRPTKPDLTPPSTPRPDAVQLRARRSPRLVALGVLLVALGGLGAGYLYTQGAQQQSVLIMADDVRRGEVLEAADLNVIEVPGNLAVSALSESELASLVGKQALTDLPRGAFPALGHVGEDPLPAGTSLVGLRLPLGKLPSTNIALGTGIRVVSLTESVGSASEAIEGVAEVEVAVEAVTASLPRLLDDGATYALDVRVSDDKADLVARLSATDRVAIVVVSA